ncbi:MAG: hypothetical protein V3U71_12015 [Cocleimonas sp.]
MKINTACTLFAEAEQLHTAIADFSSNGSRARYADWLDKQGDTVRANTVRKTIEAYQNLDGNCLKNLSGSADWQGMLGVPLLKTFIDNMEGFEQEELFKFRDSVFTHLRPALSLSYSPTTQEPKVASSYLWGLPDLAEGESWPKVAEVSNWYDAKDDLPADNHCAFIGQFAFQDFSQTVLGQELPTQDGFSVFTYTDANLGVVETLIKPWNPNATLKRQNAPEDLIKDASGDQVNTPKKAHTIELKEVLSLPDATGGAYTSIIPNCEWGEYFYDYYYTLMSVCGSGLGFGGYLQGTSGEDPSPDAKSLRFAVLRTDPDCGIVHFSIPSKDLKSGQLNRIAYVWNDWDS